MPKPPTKHATKTVVHSAATVQTAFQGPIPPPELIEHYERIVTGAAERIFRMAEDEQAHRHRRELQGLRTESRNSLCGILSALLIGLTTVICGSIVAYAGKEWPGYAISGTGLASLVGTFIYGTRTRRKERQERLQALKRT